MDTVVATNTVRIVRIFDAPRRAMPSSSMPRTPAVACVSKCASAPTISAV